MLARLFLALSAPAGLIGCSCGSGSWAPACETFDTAGAVFLGTVLDHNDNGSGRFAQWTAYLVRVDEAFRGLDPTQKEVFIDPGSFTSCYTEYGLNKQYLFVTGGPANFAAMSVTTGPRGGKPFPVRWQTKENLKVYLAAGCSPTRLAAGASEDLAWLRARLKNATPTRVYGVAVQNYEAFYRPPRVDLDSPLPGAEVILSGGGRRFTTVTDAAGRYSFDGIPPGSYMVWASKTPWTPSGQASVELRSGACAQRTLELKVQGSARGTVLSHDGKPIPGLNVEIVRVLPDGALAGAATRWATTDSEGRFHLERLAAGEFLVGVNIASAPTDREPFAPTYAPGVRQRDRGRRIQVGPNAEIAGLTLRLPPPLATRRVQVRVFWADGAPVTRDARAFADYGGYRAAFERARSGNIVDLQLEEGVEYTLSADWFSSAGEPIHYVTSEPVRLPAGRGPSTIDIKLKPKRP